MNSSQNQPFEQVLENSEATIKRDLRAGERFIDQAIERMEAGLGRRMTDMALGRGDAIAANVEALERNLYGDREGFAAMLREAMEPVASEVVEDLERMRRPVLVAGDVEMSYTLVAPGEESQPVVAFDWPLEGSHSFTATQQLVGLTNHPKVARGGAGGGRRAILMLGLALAACGQSLNDVIVVGGHGSRRLRDFDYAVFEDCGPAVEPLSVHPGERHRQLSRNLTSSRSRAGKAARWASRVSRRRSRRLTPTSSRATLAGASGPRLRDWSKNWTGSLSRRGT